MQSGKKNKRCRSVYFIVPAPPGISPGQRFRFEQYLVSLNKENINYKISAFYFYKGWSILHSSGNLFLKFILVLTGFFKRILDLFHLPFYSYVFVYREATPLGPPVFEWIIAKVFRKKIIYDFDDAIWIPAVSANNKIALRFRWFSKVAYICRLAYTVTTGNQFLADYAAQYCKKVLVIPTVVNTEKIQKELQNHQVEMPVVGWTGTHTTLKYLDIVIPVLERLQEKINFTFVVIANKDPKLPLRNYRFIPWTSVTEIDDLLTIHIGLMPLYNGELEKGKCGFKAIQYMALGIPALVSPVGVNAEIVNDGVNGFICETEYDWESKISLLLQDSRLRTVLGKTAKKKIEDQYSVKATEQAFLEIFKS